MTWPLVETSSGVSASIPTRARLFPVRVSFLRIQGPPYGHDHASVRTSTSATTARWSGETIKIGIAGSIRAALATGWPMTSASPFLVKLAPIAESDGKLVGAPARLAVVGHLDHVCEPVYPVDPCGARDHAIGARVVGPQQVAGHARSVHLHRRARAVVVVLQVAPEGSGFAPASDAEIRAGAERQGRRSGADDEATTCYEVTGRAPDGDARAHRMAGDDQEAYRHDVNDAAHGSDEARRGPHQMPAVAEAMTTSAIPSTMT